MRRPLLTLSIFLLIFLVVILALTLGRDLSDPRSQDFIRWLRGSQADRDALVTGSEDACPGAPFIMPTEGFIGLLYGDPRGPYSASNPHQGIDIFSNAEPGESPVFAAYDGYLRREADWRSSIILRVPSDPLRPDNQIWLYYTHMADREGNDFIEEAFAPGTAEIFVPRGTLLGFTGNYNGSSPRNIGVHLHFSIVEDDGFGRYRNELEFTNTVDPSPYLGLSVNYACESESTNCDSFTSC